MRNECWAIIPARAGSKGVKGKNLKKLGNMPLVCYSIQKLQEAKCFDKIIVTSDCSDILKVSQEHGADIHLRNNNEESNDIVMPDIPVISCLKSFSKELRPMFSFMIQCTSPFIKVSSYQRAYEKLLNHPNSTVFAAHDSHDFLWQPKTESDTNSSWIPINHLFHERVGRQYKKNYQVNETGAFYGFPTEDFISARHRFFSEAFPVIIEDDELVDINNSSDWAYAEYINKIRSM
ncbi:MAG: hypothetical protein CMQ88_03425 [Gammaproteobacteria bacterium]|nr:hypothetical protein [Gammaproteobacteria bacterium]